MHSKNTVLIFDRWTRQGEWRSLALEQARWPLFIKANFGVQIILFKLEKLKKKLWKGKKVIAKGLHEACYSRIQIMTMNEWLEEHFEWFFHKLRVYNIHFFLNACDFLPLKLFSIVTCTLQTIASNNLKLQTFKGSLKKNCLITFFQRNHRN